MENHPKFHKLEKVQEYLVNAVTFLNNYLPLVNAHAADFIVKKHWDQFIPEEIKTELMSLTEQQLLLLPVLYPETKSDIKSELSAHGKLHSISLSEEKAFCYKLSSTVISEENNAILLPKLSSLSQCKNITCAKKENLKNLQYKIIQTGPNWIHDNLKSFIEDARRCSLPDTDFVLSREDFGQKYSLSKRTVSITPDGFMKKKKHHEIDVMSNLCSALAHTNSVDVVCDVGSGKGYLGTQLAFQHKIAVLGIDAARINTAGAMKRTRILGKQWKGLIRKAIGKKCSSGLANNRTNEDKLSSDYSNEFCEEKQKIQNKQIDPDCSAVVKTADKEISCHNRLEICETAACSVGCRCQLTNTNVEATTCSDGCGSKSDNSLSPYNQQHSNTPDVCSNKSDIPESGRCTSSIKSDISVSDKCTIKLHRPEQPDLNTPVQVNKNLACDQGSTKDSTELSLSASLYVPVTVHLDSTTDLSGIVRGAFSHIYADSPRQPKLMLTGLHTCGALGSNILRLFIEDPSMCVLSYVPCCYQLMEEEFVASPYPNSGEPPSESGFPLSTFLKQNKVGLGRTARNLASQSVHRIITDSVLQGKKFYPRALLQMIIHDMGFTGDSFKGLRKLDQRSTDIFNYVRLAFKKLGLPENKLTDKVIQDYCERYKDKENQLASFFQLRACLAPCIESIVLLDRVCYLLEQENINDVELVQLFDPLISPRCYGIIAFKTSDLQIH